MTPPPASSVDALARVAWDVVIVGTGMAGATLGYRLAQAGKRVLFCEKGGPTDAAAQALRGGYPEMAGGRHGAIPPRDADDALRQAGRYRQQVPTLSDRGAGRFVPFIGSGVGGSSALYGMALERFWPSDFEPRAHHPQAAGSTLEDRWPVSYATMLPYYAEAERLYRVRGSDDPLLDARPSEAQLGSPPALTRGASELLDFLRLRQLHPYRLPLACDAVADCAGCQGYLCARDCKNDSARICMRPAQQLGATLLTGCDVRGLEADRSRVSAVHCVVGKQPVSLRAKTVVLAAGALHTPAILLRSTSAHWPRGVANDSGLVGCNLMRHFIDLYLIEPSGKESPGLDNRFKELAFNDFYCGRGEKLGSVQSFGQLPPAEMLFESLLQDIRDGRRPYLAPVAARLRPLLLPTFRRLQTRSIALATTIEDLPYAENRVQLQPAASDGAAEIGIQYHLQPEARARIAKMRTLMGEVLKSRRWRRLKQAENIQRIAHACGTCRFGDDPDRSVLDRDNRTHGLDNLYVIDASFFPSSGGTNPGLTIAANALRVADHLLSI